MGNELFKNIPSKVGDLVKDVRNGRIGLPHPHFPNNPTVKVSLLSKCTRV